MTEPLYPENKENLSKPTPSKSKNNAKRAIHGKKERLKKDKRNLKLKEERLKALEKLTEGEQGLLDEEVIQEAPKSVQETIKDKEVVWRPNPGVQTDFLSASEDEVLFAGGRGSGKSDALIMDPLRYCHNKNFRGLIIRRTMPELRELISRAKDKYPRAFPGTKWKEMEKLFVFPSGARMEFGYCSNEDDAQRYQGQEYTWLGVDEITQYPDDSILEKLKLSLRSTDPSLPIHIRATTNPSGSGRGWVKERWVNFGPSGKRIEIVYSYDPEDPNAKSYTITRKWFTSTADDNPVLVESNPRYLASLAGIQNETLRRQWKDGDWNCADGLAFTEFDQNKHTVEPFPIPSNWYKFRACDWGFGSLAVCLWFAVDFNNNIYVYREFATKHTNADVFAGIILDKEQGESVKVGYLDGSVWSKRGEMGETPADTMLRLGCNWVPSDRSKGSRVAGKLLVHRYLSIDPVTAQPRLKIFNNCHQLIKELSNLPLDEDNPEDVDTKAEDHAYDALRYGLLSRPDIHNPDPFSSELRYPKPVVIDSTFGY